MAFPSVTFDASKTTLITKVFGSYLSDKSGAVQVDFIGDVVDYDGNTTVKELKFPGTDGLIRPLRRDQTEESEWFKVHIYDLAKQIAIFGGFNGFDTGTVTLWMLDPKDATGHVKWKSEAFACTVEKDGGMKFSKDDYTAATLKFTSTKAGRVTWTADGVP